MEYINRKQFIGLGLYILFHIFHDISIGMNTIYFDNEGERFSMLEYVVDNRESFLNVHGIVLLVSKSNVI